MAVLNKYVYQTLWLAKCITVAVVIQIICCLKQKGQKPSGSYNLHFLDSLQLVLIKQHLKTLKRSIFIPGSVFLGLTHPRHKAFALISEQPPWIRKRFMWNCSLVFSSTRWTVPWIHSLKPDFENLPLSKCFSVPKEGHRKDASYVLWNNQKKTAQQETWLYYFIHPRRLAQLLSHFADEVTTVQRG